jgi:hypothetical protein
MPLGEACVGYRGQSRLQRRIIMDQTDLLSVWGTKYIYVYLEYHSVCPLSPNGTPHHFNRKRVCPPPEPMGGGGVHYYLSTICHAR